MLGKPSRWAGPGPQHYLTSPGLHGPGPLLIRPPLPAEAAAIPGRSWVGFGLGMAGKRCGAVGERSGEPAAKRACGPRDEEFNGTHFKALLRDPAAAAKGEAFCGAGEACAEVAGSG